MVPHLPAAESLLPFLRRIDSAHWYTNGGPLETELRQALAGYWLDAGFEVAEDQVATFSSGTLALEMSLLALGIGPGCRVLVPSLTFPATATAVVRCGATPVLADVDPDTWQLTVGMAERVLRDLPVEAVIPVGPWGTRVPGNEWAEFSRETQVPVIVDAAAGFGTQEPVAGITVVYSLHATKPFSAAEGGIAVGPPDIVESARTLSNFGFDQRRIVVPGTNAKLSEYHAAVALASLQDWPATIRKRREIRGWYSAAFSRATRVPGRVLSCSEWNSLDAQPIVLDRPAGDVQRQLADRGIEVRIGYAPPLHDQPAFAASRFFQDGAFRNCSSVSDWLFDHTLLLPMHPGLDEAAVVRVREALEGVWTEASPDTRQRP